MTNKNLVATLQRLITGMNESLVLFDQDGKIIHASYGLEKLFESKGLLGQSIFEFIEVDSSETIHFLKSVRDTNFKDLKINGKRGGVLFPIRLRLATWSVSETDFVVLASLVDGTVIERKKRSLLRKTLTIERLSKSETIRSGNLYEAIYEILELSSKAVNASRVNAWLFNEDHSMMECIGNFDAKENQLIPQTALPVLDMPRYFDLFRKEKIIVVNHARTNIWTTELLSSYLIPNDIYALMDIPLRLEGQIIGVICFEQVEKPRNWSLHDQKFGLISAQLTSLAVETFNRKKAQKELEEMIQQKDRLMVESNHRIKNNLAISASLMRLQLDKCKDDYHKSVIQDSINRIQSIAALHDLLVSNESHHQIEMGFYAQQIIDGIKGSLSESGNLIEVIVDAESIEIEGSIAITLGLIINELVTNSFKHAFLPEQKGEIRASLSCKANLLKLKLTDNGKGFSSEEIQGEGYEIIKGLADHLDATWNLTGEKGLNFTLQFQIG